MLVTYINSKLSMPKRLALIASLFVVPSLVQLQVFAQASLASIDVAETEVKGASYAKEVWKYIEAPSQSISKSFPDSLEKLVTAFNGTFGTTNEIELLKSSSNELEKAARVRDIIEKLADVSGMILDPHADTYYAMALATQELPIAYASAITAIDGLSRPLVGDNGAKLLISYDRLLSYSHRAVEAGNSLMRYDDTQIGRTIVGASFAEFKADLAELESKHLADSLLNIQEIEENRVLIEKISRKITILGDKTFEAFIALQQNHINESYATMFWRLGLLVCFGLAAGIFVVLIARGLSARLSNLLSAMDRISHNDASVVVPFIGDRNENGQIAGALERFKENLLHNIQLSKEAEIAAKAKEVEGEHYAHEHEKFMDAFLRASDKIAGGEFSYRITEKVIPEYDAIVSEMNKMVERLGALQAQKSNSDAQIQRIVNVLGASLAALADGNLEIRFNIDVEPEFVKLKDDFNAAVSELQGTIASVKQGAERIKLGTDEISLASDDLSRRTENQAASLEQTAAAVSEITSSVNKTASGANNAREIVLTAKADAERSGEVVRRAIEAMTAIDSSSKQISQIIGVIDEIAFQTNLLALNAGVEAARAGDAGRGFAVVASEVRALAQRSAGAAKEIKSLISASSAQVAQGVNLVGETGQSLGRIVERVAEINSVVTKIAASATEEANGLSQVNTAVNEMDQVTQQNAAMVEQATASTRKLAEQTEELAQLVSKFHTGEMSVRPMQSARDNRPSPRAAKPQPRLKVAAGGRRAASAADAGWEEF